MTDFPLQLSEEVIKFFKKKRFYVFFADGTWRTCEEEQWKEEQIWKLKPVYSNWFNLSDYDLKVISAVIERYSVDKTDQQQTVGTTLPIDGRLSENSKTP